MPLPEGAPGHGGAARWYGLAAGVIVLDQLSKAVVLALLRTGDSVPVTPFFNWVLTWNPGAAFSFLADSGGWQRWFFTGLALLVGGWIAWLLRQPQPRAQAGALALILGGALGNAIDRVRFGAVVDFVDLHVAGWHWPAFNVADSAICVGAALLIWEQMRGAPVQSASDQTGDRPS